MQRSKIPWRDICNGVKFLGGINAWSKVPLRINAIKRYSFVTKCREVKFLGGINAMK